MSRYAPMLVPLLCACGFDPSATASSDQLDEPPADAGALDAAQPDSAASPACATDPSYVAAANGRRYFLSTNPQSWNDAQQSCSAVGAYLVVIDDESEQDIVADMQTSAQLWIGATDQGMEGTWQWVTGAAIGYEHWAVGEPNDFFDQDCGAIPPWTSGYWDDSWCDSAERFVCECDN